MKGIYKIFTILMILLVIILLVPDISLADNGRDTNNRRSNTPRGSQAQVMARKNSEEQKNKQICNKIADWAERIDQTISGRQDKIEEKQVEREQKLEQKRDSRDARLETYREKWGEHWDEHFAKLENKASTSEEKLALVEFKETVIDAMASRQAAVDKAISDFRTALDKTILDRKNAVDAAKIAYQDAYNEAVQKAKDDCAAGANPAEIRATLKAALKAAKDQYNSARRAIEKMDLKPLVEARQEAFKEALDYFKKVMETERAELKAAFKV